MMSIMLSARAGFSYATGNGYGISSEVIRGND